MLWIWTEFDTISYESNSYHIQNNTCTVYLTMKLFQTGSLTTIKTIRQKMHIVSTLQRPPTNTGTYEPTHIYTDIFTRKGYILETK